MIKTENDSDIIVFPQRQIINIQSKTFK